MVGRRELATLVILLSAILPLHGEDRNTQYEAAKKLEQGGDEAQAFLAFLAIPGAQHEAARIGRTRPDEFRHLLLEKADGLSISRPHFKAVEGDLLLAQGRKDEALACYRAASACMETTEDQDWSSGHIPADEYLAELPPRPEGQRFFSRLADPFTFGPGSHRDNWLLRRFIALECWDDAEKEFARVWQIHRRNSRPHRVTVAVRQPDGSIVEQEHLIEPAGFNGKGLQFALDYYFFLNRHQKEKVDKALAVLEEPLLAIDMDRNPNQGRAFPHAGFPMVLSIVSRKEFVRLAFGAIKAAGKEAELIDKLNQRIDAGENRLRRVLARIRFHQNKIAEGLALELEFIEKAEFDALTAAYRRGLVFEETQKPAKAIEAYELALRLPYSPPDLPDADEEAVRSNMMSQVALPPPNVQRSANRAQFQSSVLNKLQRLYGAMGRLQEASETTIRQFEANPALLARIDTLIRAQRGAEAAGQGERLRKWLVQHAPQVETPAARANIYWVLKDYAACARAVAAAHDPDGGRLYEFVQWMERFRTAGDGPLRVLLTELQKVDPDNARVRLELLNLTGDFNGPDVIEAFEQLLESDAQWAFARGKGNPNRTRFRNYFDLAYRLMRLYEKHSQFDKLRSLGLRIAKGDKPFGRWWEKPASYDDYRDDGDLPEDVNPCLAVLIQNADAATLRELDRLWKDREDFPARRQLARRLAGSEWQSREVEDIGWADLPASVRAIASSEDVLCVAHDDKYVYAGQPWGVTVYDREGTPVTRVALTTAARLAVTAHGFLWVGTPKGLYRINPDGWTVRHLWLDGDIPERARHRSPFSRDDEPSRDNGVFALAVDGNEIWIGLRRNVQRLDPRTMALRVYSARELKTDRWYGADRIVPDREYVWIASNQTALRRYDRASDTWDVVDFGQRGAGLIGIIDGRLFGHVWLNNELRDRPCLIDRATLEVTPLLIEGNLSDDQRQINGPFCYFGTRDGRLVFGPGHRRFVLDEEIGKLRPIEAAWEEDAKPIQSILPAQYRYEEKIWMAPIDSGAITPNSLEQTQCVRQANGNWTLLISPDGLMVAAGRQAQGPRYEYPQEDWPFGDIVWDKKDSAGGLHFLGIDGESRRVSGSLRADAILANNVFTAVPDPAIDRVWLCTDLGLATLDPEGQVTGRLSRRDGLCCNRVTSAVALEGKLYFSTAWGDHGGGLGIFDPATNVATARFQQDGLATNKLARIEEHEGHIRLVYDVEYGRANPAYELRQFAPGMYDPATHEVDNPGEPRYMSRSDVHTAFGVRPRGPREAMPYLGGFLLDKKSISGRTYLCGTRGLIVCDSVGLPHLQFAELRASIVTDPALQWKEEARNTRFAMDEPADLRRYLQSENPYLRAGALRAVTPTLEIPASFVPIVAECVDDSHLRVRSTAVFLLAHSGSDAVIPAMEKAMKDPDPEIRAVATLTLTRLGHRPALEHLEPILRGQSGIMPVGIEARIGTPVSRNRAYEALAPGADAAIFELLLKYPPGIPRDESPWIYPELAKALRQDPKIADMLLTFYDERDPHQIVPSFREMVFRHAGTSMLPRLFAALKSDDRVVRSNAARACGTIGDPSAVRPLIEALDLESGLSRGSIVWALGELDAESALPHLIALYTDARADEKRRRGSGFRMAQAAAAVQSQVEQLQDLETIGAEFDELKALARPVPVDPRRNEPLLSPAMILEAVRKIDPQAAQPFYRKLAADDDPDARNEAAQRLADCSPADTGKSLPVLRSLLADDVFQVRAAAGVSLLILGDESLKDRIVAWLDKSNRWEQRLLIDQLGRVEDAAALAFARPALERITKDPNSDRQDIDKARNLLERIAKPDA